MTKEECEIETNKAIMEMRNHIEELKKRNRKTERKIKRYGKIKRLLKR